MVRSEAAVINDGTTRPGDARIPYDSVQLRTRLAAGSPTEGVWPHVKGNAANLATINVDVPEILVRNRLNSLPHPTTFDRFGTETRLAFADLDDPDLTYADLRGTRPHWRSSQRCGERRRGCHPNAVHFTMPDVV